MQNALVAENGRQRGLQTQTETGGKEENEISREIEKRRSAKCAGFFDFVYSYLLRKYVCVVVLSFLHCCCASVRLVSKRFRVCV